MDARKNLFMKISMYLFECVMILSILEELKSLQISYSFIATASIIF